MPPARRDRPGVHPRGLYRKLGWTQHKTNKTAARARARMLEFAERRASGALCDELRDELDALAAVAGRATDSAGPEIDSERFELVLMHVRGCASWVARRPAARRLRAPARRPRRCA